MTDKIISDPGPEKRPEQKDAGATKPAKRRPEKTQVNQTVENRFKRVIVENGFFGFGSQSGDSKDSTTGEIFEEEVRSATSTYVEPDCFDAALVALRKNRAVILQGQPGTGRRTGALALVSKFGADQVQRIQPGVTLEELQTWEYEAGTAYVVFDHVGPRDGIDAEFRWETLLGRLRSMDGTGLVITRTGSTRYADGIDWERPRPEILVPHLLAGTIADGLSGEVLAALPDDWTLTNAAECCRRLADDPQDVAGALAVFNRAATEQVADWFDGDRPRRDTVEITALAFGVGLGERRFEETADLFEEVLGRYVPLAKGTRDKDRPASDSLNRRRRIRQSAARELIERAQLRDGLVPRQVLRFRSEHHWRAVLEELHGNYSASFWDAVREWIKEILEESPTDDDVAAVAHGLAGLSLVDIGETLSILNGLTQSVSPDLAATDCAAATLSMMANEDAVAPMALQIAIDWLGQRNLFRRLAAGTALIDDLGLRYTAEASRRLWQLITQDDELGQAALSTPALLFASLVSDGRDAAELLDLVLAKVERFNGPELRRRADGSIVPRSQRMVDLSLRMTHLLLGVTNADLQTEPDEDAADRLSELDDGDRSDRSERRRVPAKRRTSVLEYLRDRPAAADTVARLWIALLRNRRYRFDAMQTLWDGLRGCAEKAETGPLLGAALARNFQPRPEAGPGELDRFISDFRTFDHRKRRRPDIKLEPVADIIIQYLENTYGTSQGVSA